MYNLITIIATQVLTQYLCVAAKLWTGPPALATADAPPYKIRR
jgi:hypothetical protein